LAEGRKRRAESGELRAESGELRARSGELRAKIRELRAKSGGCVVLKGFKLVFFIYPLFFIRS